MFFVVVIPIRIIDVRLLSRSARKESVAGEGAELCVVAENGANDLEHGRMNGDLFEDFALVNEVPDASLEFGFGFFRALAVQIKDDHRALYTYFC